MEPKPTFTWKTRHQSKVLHLTPTDENLPDYDIAIYLPYGDLRRPYLLVADFWHDMQDKIAESHNLDELKERGIQYWFHCYVNR